MITLPEHITPRAKFDCPRRRLRLTIDQCVGAYRAQLPTCIGCEAGAKAREGLRLAVDRNERRVKS